MESDIKLVWFSIRELDLSLLRVAARILNSLRLKLHFL